MTFNLLETCALVDIGLTRSECASWVQAWGSVLAIIAAISIAAWQKHQDRAREELRDRAKSFQQMETLVTLASHAVFLMDAMPYAGADSGVYKAYLALRHPSINEPGGALRAFGPEHVPDGSALVQALTLMRCAGEAQAEREICERYFWIADSTVQPETLENSTKKLDDIRCRATASLGMLKFIQGKYQAP